LEPPLSGGRHIRDLRRRISSDLHDEVGSNLATISLLADITPAAGANAPLEDIGRLARESSFSLREIIDLTLAPKHALKPLPDRLRDIAGLMLKDHTWKLSGESSPDLDPEQRRNVSNIYTANSRSTTSPARLPKRCRSG
jgi:signal transduction histidine kinase